MKKLITSALLLGLSSMAMANIATPTLAQPVLEEAPLVTMPEQATVEPKMILGTFERTNTGFKPTSQNAVSRSNPNMQICWIAFDLNMTPKVNVTELIISPQRTIFGTATGQSSSSADGKQHQILSTLDNVNGTVSQCWQFDKTDPIGQYSIDIQIDDIVFPTQIFNVIK